MIVALCMTTLTQHYNILIKVYYTILNNTLLVPTAQGLLIYVTRKAYLQFTVYTIFQQNVQHKQSIVPAYHNQALHHSVLMKL